MSLSIGFVLFPKLTQLDFTGPLQVLSRAPEAVCYLVADSLDPVGTDTVLAIPPTTTFAECPPIDVLVVPGGFGVADAIRERSAVSFVRERATDATWITSVCTGAFILGAAGLLHGKRATTHWAYKELLPLVGASPGGARVIRDGNIVTGGGVTAGIDFALTLLAEVASPGVAQTVQLSLEYDPAPPFDAGNPKFAPEPVRDKLSGGYQVQRDRMRAALVGQ
jgi:cyclohexyl-isocyanide hydratase